MKYINKKKALKWHKASVLGRWPEPLKLWCQRHISKGKFSYTMEYDIGDEDQYGYVIKIVKTTWYFEDAGDAVIFKIMGGK